MFDKLIKRLRRCASYDPRFVIQDCEDAADAIEELQKITTHYEEESKGWWLAACDAKEERERLKEQIPKWIPVTERLPEKYVSVWTYSKFGMLQDEYIGEYDGENYFARQTTHVTHWMPLPQPPKTEN